MNLNGRLATILILLTIEGLSADSTLAQDDARASRNLVALQATQEGALALDVDQHPDRPFVYVANSGAPGFSIVSVDNSQVVATWSPPQSTAGTADLAIAGLSGRYFVLALAGESLDVVDVTDPYNPAFVQSYQPECGNDDGKLFAYRHSSGAAVVAIARGGEICLYDLATLIAGEGGAVTIRTPEQLERGSTGFDTVYMEYHLPSAQDRLYGGGAGGYHVFDITDLSKPESLVSVNPATIARGQAIAPTPDGRYVVTTAAYKWSPVRVFDLQPMFSGETSLVRTSESAWTPNWKGLTRAVEVRWPLVFTASSGDGLQVFNLRDAANPYTIAYFQTGETGRAESGAYDVDVRNHDGKIVLADSESGVWILQLDELQQWNGHGFGLPNTSSAQDWVAGPDETGPE